MEYVDPLRKRTQINSMKRALKSKSLRDYCLFTVGINTGLRISDLLALSINDVLIPCGARRYKVASRVTVREKKTGKRRDMILNTPARSAISSYLRQRRWKSMEEPVFLSRKHNPDGTPKSLSRVQVWTVLSDAAHRAGIEDAVGTHTMRKTFGYFRYKAGRPLEEIQKMFGHSHGYITLAYIGITREQIEDSYRKIEL